MKKYIMLAVALTALIFSYSNSYAWPGDMGGKNNKTSSYSSRDDLLNLLGEIQVSLKNNDIKSIKGKSYKIEEIIKSRKEASTKSAAPKSEAPKLEKILELSFGKLTSPESLIIPLKLKNNEVRVKTLESTVDLSSFKKDQINEGRIRYVTYDDNKASVTNNLNLLLTSVNKGDPASIRRSVSDLYSDIFKDSDWGDSVTSKISDNITLARFLISQNQAKAAGNSVKWTDGVILQLIEMTPDQDTKQRMTKLREDLKDVSRLADEKYLSEWEKIGKKINKAIRN